MYFPRPVLPHNDNMYISECQSISITRKNVHFSIFSNVSVIFILG